MIESYGMKKIVFREEEDDEVIVVRGETTFDTGTGLFKVETDQGEIFISKKAIVSIKNNSRGRS